MKLWFSGRHPHEGDLRAYLDAELPAARQNAVLLHLETCTGCRTRLAEVQAGATLTAQAVRAFQAALPAVTPPTLPTTLKEVRPMTTTSWRRALPYGAAATVLALMVTIVVVPPLRATAAQWLSVFRTEKITTVQFDPQQIRPAVKPKAITPELARKFGLESGPTAMPQAQRLTLDQAAALVGGNLHTPKLPAGLQETPTEVRGLASEQFVIKPDVDAINTWLQQQNVPARLSARLKGQEVRLQTPAVALRLWGTPPGKFFALGEGTPLQVEGTAGIDLKDMIDFFAQMAGVPADIREQLQAIPDLASTLVLPVSKENGQTFRAGDKQGVYYRAPDGASSALVWTQNGRMYVAVGTYSEQELLQAVSW